MQTVIFHASGALQSPMPSPHDTPIEEQLQAALNSFLRVRRMLSLSLAIETGAEATKDDARTGVYEHALCDVLVSRPILFQALQNGLGRELYASYMEATAIDATTAERQREWRVPKPPDAWTPGMRTRLHRLCNTRRVDLIDRIGNLAVDAIGDDPMHAQRISVLNRGMDDAGVWVVPACGLSMSGPRSISDTHVLEDAVVWLEVLNTQLWTPLIISKNATTIAATEWTAMTPSDAEHPFTFSTQTTTLGAPMQGIMCLIERMPPRPTTTSVPNASLPETMRATFARMRAFRRETADPDGRITGLLRDRTRTLLWLIDRFVQLHVLLSGETGGAPNGQLPLHVVRPPSSWDEATIAHAAVAMGIARALCACAFTTALDVRIVADLDNSAALDALLAPARAVAAAAKLDARAHARDSPPPSLRAVPLAELCHVLAASLP
jgi:hypothetical protein